ncbi:hypothetical protein KZZ52_30705 [Dactylosporangium sp. AC04546]|uniref:hypothetical protein n=1 Tax=Dactylosporangium sp. AC04546 TaxID=2862460 RepID=UPI001EDE3EB9|nr:hypothetical protein [Dactylosporangium sp. AC04546]WVK78365.1 hypothetical protein KZZ52_30705 [Dactylosporangium sp. AC04546]
MAVISGGAVGCADTTLPFQCSSGVRPTTVDEEHRSASRSVQDFTATKRHPENMHPTKFPLRYVSHGFIVKDEALALAVHGQWTTRHKTRRRSWRMVDE